MQIYDVEIAGITDDGKAYRLTLTVVAESRLAALEQARAYVAEKAEQADNDTDVINVAQL